MNNLTGYALGIEPGQPDAGRMPAVEANESAVTLIYTKEVTATDITYAIEQSSDLIAWVPASPVNEVVATMGTIQTIKARVPRGTEPRLFLRLRVTRA